MNPRAQIKPIRYNLTFNHILSSHNSWLCSETELDLNFICINLCVTLNEFLKLYISSGQHYKGRYTFSEILYIKNLAECLTYGRNLHIINCHYYDLLCFLPSRF